MNGSPRVELELIEQSVPMRKASRSDSDKLFESVSPLGVTFLNVSKIKVTLSCHVCHPECHMIYLLHKPVYGCNIHLAQID